MKSTYEFPVSIGESLYYPRIAGIIDELIVVGFEISNNQYVLAETVEKVTGDISNWRIPTDQIGKHVFLTEKECLGHHTRARKRYETM